ncbi:MAG TPA: TonB family protein, partial [Bryobacteraceae bacterium]|nr:TonB family protein [Bryobacteraceae bacterium]
ARSDEMPAPEPPSPTDIAEQPETSPQWRAVRDAIVRALRYPEASRQRGEEGRVWLQLRLRPDGSIESLDAEGDVPRLVAAVIDAVRRAAPFPGAGPAVYRIPVSFRLVPPNGARLSPAAGVTFPRRETWRRV